MATIASKIAELLALDVSKNSGPIRELLADFSGLLKIHLAAEDKALYPLLLQHKDPAMKAIAGKFMTEMGGLRTALEAYLGKWPSSASITQKPDSFRSETTALFHALRKRIDRENSELYPRVDSLN
ncbi:MAG: hemerythrin domain-containing protein [Acidobacteria bacterium]|nr:hemerythrin domain-containing protein [Acidobacteriota bacterium]